MKSKLLIATLALTGLGAVGYFTTTNFDRTPETFVNFLNSQDLTSIVLTKDGKEVKLSQNQDLERWMVALPDGPQVIADANKIVRLLDALNDAKTIQHVTKKKDHYDRFEIGDHQAQKIQIKRKGKDDLTLYLGKSNDGASQFVRKNSEPSIYLISEKIHFAADARDWMHKKLRLNKEDVKKLSYKTKDKKELALSYDAATDKFNLSGSPPTNKKLKNLSSLATQFTDISVKDLTKQKEVKTPKTVTEHQLILKDDTKVVYRFLESKEDKNNKRYFLKFDIENGAATTSPRLKYIASLSKDYVFEIHNISPQTFQKEWGDFFEPHKEEKK